MVRPKGSEEPERNSGTLIRFAAYAAVFCLEMGIRWLGCIRSYATMELVESRLTGKKNNLTTGIDAGSAPHIVVGLSTPWASKSCLVTAQLLPLTSGHQQGVGLSRKPKPPPLRRTTGHRDVKEAVTIVAPWDRLQQRVLCGLVVAVEHRPHLNLSTKMKTERANYRPGRDTKCRQATRQESWRRDPRPIDHDANISASGGLEALIDSPDWGRGSSSMFQDSDIGRYPLAFLFDGRLSRPIVNDHDLIVALIKPSLKKGR